MSHNLFSTNECHTTTFLLFEQIRVLRQKMSLLCCNHVVTDFNLKCCPSKKSIFCTSAITVKNNTSEQMNSYTIVNVSSLIWECHSRFFKNIVCFRICDAAVLTSCLKNTNTKNQTFVPFCYNKNCNLRQSRLELYQIHTVKPCFLHRHCDKICSYVLIGPHFCHYAQIMLNPYTFHS